jgi:hypothetical protein
MALKPRYNFLTCALLIVFLLALPTGSLWAQGGNACTLRNGKMYIELRKDASNKDLNDFINRYNLGDLDLLGFVRKNDDAAIRKHDWTIEMNTAAEARLSKKIGSADNIYDPSQRMRLTGAADRPSPRAYGVNRFRNKRPFSVKDSVVLFYLRANTDASRVQLAGSFTNWEKGTLPMRKTDSGWIAAVKLPPGKYWYKFIINGDWKVDSDNLQNESDGHGNINSVFFVVNHLFHLAGFVDSRQVVLAGSFNGWRENELRMLRAGDGWYLPLYLSDGTHTYKFIADGKWMTDPANADKLPGDAGGYNSVIRLGQAFTFLLNDYTGAKRVFVSGSFNGWKHNELFLQRTATGWSLPYVLGPGNYEYKFNVDGKWMPDPANPLNTENPRRSGNSILVVGANYTFRIKGKDNLKKVNIAGDFNGWNPSSFPMHKEGTDWVIALFLAPGKHRYKLFADGAWILDPGNKLWEQNEFNTGNSVLWVE